MSDFDPDNFPLFECGDVEESFDGALAAGVQKGQLAVSVYPAEVGITISRKDALELADFIYQHFR